MLLRNRPSFFRVDPLSSPFFVLRSPLTVVRAPSPSPSHRTMSSYMEFCPGRRQQQKTVDTRKHRERSCRKKDLTLPPPLPTNHFKLSSPWRRSVPYPTPTPTPNYEPPTPTPTPTPVRCRCCMSLGCQMLTFSPFNKLYSDRGHV